ncbi:MAG TPA: hypothetical protein VFN56_04810 [Candidatus Saccharimonadales bacterium]|nr:hypothetical protein [Candidatus Saccharimonadales bacterium]
MEAVDTNGLTYSPINATAPLALIYIGSKSVTRIDYRSILTRATISAVVSWLIVYVLNDRRSKLRAVNRSAKLKVK